VRSGQEAGRVPVSRGPSLIEGAGMWYVTVLRIVIYVAAFSILAWGTIGGLILALQASAIRNRQASSPRPTDALRHVISRGSRRSSSPSHVVEA
jgi:hypothetical protein